MSSLFKGKNKNLYTYGSLIGGFLILLIIAVLCFSGESSTTQTPKMDKRAYHDQAYEYTNKGEFEKAIAAYKKAYELDPNDSYATDQISILYRNELHDESNAEFWKSKSEQITANKVDSNRGASAKAYEEKAARKAQRRGGGR
ncbi:MAG: tetratricopeptide repeat protein [Thermoguttaceae bacterium]|nr:tetratricopeptide repeat protein [Thermoguttaceae bacterium]